MNREPDDETAAAINLTILCQKFKQLPRPGGVLDQDAYHVHLLQTVLQVIEEKREMEEKRSKARRGNIPTKPRTPARRRR
jgi:hypothetical protein